MIEREKLLHFVGLKIQPSLWQQVCELAELDHRSGAAVLRMAAMQFVLANKDKLTKETRSSPATGSVAKAGRKPARAA